MIIVLTPENKYIMTVQLELSEWDIDFIKRMYKPISVTQSKNTTSVKIQINSKCVRPLVAHLTYKEYITRGKSKFNKSESNMVGSGNPPDFIGDYILNH
ncbi:MAG: hypothetical protein AMQ22_00596 [Candidatus Methanofastidiosum methylothiophilum]|uniref:Uncharacterized protein n=1 Tax=Candidatus Methanofastidiosum methylothiophilum TaxID=1705564 RepID=A0A150J6Q8_9EURY|nr:MAG: hypothetical protein AMQ22_00596 [Candidatus Methanofastidiosum methylthiophilus]